MPTGLIQQLFMSHAGIAETNAAAMLVFELGLEVHPEAMRRSLAITGGGIMAEPVSRLLAPVVAHKLQCTGKRYALCTMYIGVGQGIATLIERV